MDKKELQRTKEILESIRDGYLRNQKNVKLDERNDSIVYISTPKIKKKKYNSDGFINLLSLIGILSVLGILAGMLLSIWR